MRPDERRPVPDLLLGRLGEAAGEGVTRRLARELRGVGRVGQAAAARRPPRPGRSRDGPRPAAPRARPAAAGAPRGPRPPTRAAPGPRTAAPPGSPAPRGSRAAARCAAGGPGRRSRARGRRRRSLAGEPVERLPPERRRARDEQHLLGREEDRPEHAGEPGGPARDAVHADPLAGATGRRPDERDLDRVAVLGRRGSPADASLDPGKLLAPPDELALGGRAMAAAPGEEHDRLEEARLARGVGPPDELRAGLEHGVERPVAAEVADGEPAQDRRVGDRRRRCRVVDQALRDALRQDVVRTGITTCTYASSPTGLNTPGDSGPLSSSANRSAWTLLSTSLRYRALNAIVVASPSTVASTSPV